MGTDQNHYRGLTAKGSLSSPSQSI